MFLKELTDKNEGPWHDTGNQRWHALCWLNGAMTTSIVKRSGVYHLLNTIAPINHKLKAELDIIGSIGILLLGLGLVIAICA